MGYLVLYFIATSDSNHLPEAIAFSFSLSLFMLCLFYAPIRLVITCIITYSISFSLSKWGVNELFPMFSGEELISTLILWASHAVSIIQTVILFAFTYIGFISGRRVK